MREKTILGIARLQAICRISSLRVFQKIKIFKKLRRHISYIYQAKCSSKHKLILYRYQGTVSKKRCFPDLTNFRESHFSCIFRDINFREFRC